MCKYHGCSSSSTSEPLTTAPPSSAPSHTTVYFGKAYHHCSSLPFCFWSPAMTLRPTPSHPYPFIPHSGTAFRTPGPTCQHRHLSRSRWVRGRLERSGCARYARRPLVEQRGVLAKIGAHWRKTDAVVTSWARSWHTQKGSTQRV